MGAPRASKMSRDQSTLFPLFGYSMLERQLAKNVWIVKLVKCVSGEKIIMVSDEENIAGKKPNTFSVADKLQEWNLSQYTEISKG